MGLFKRRNKSKQNKFEEEIVKERTANPTAVSVKQQPKESEAAPSPAPETNEPSTRNQKREKSNKSQRSTKATAASDESQFHHSEVRSRVTQPTNRRTDTGRPRDDENTGPPPAREAAFHGPPRFDWIDIETAAAIKVQSVYRRNKVMSDMEAKGISTSAIRNRRRRRKAATKSYRSRATQSADVPSFLNCCGVGMAFGDATEEDDEAYRQLQKERYTEQKRQQAMHEDALRKRYMHNRPGPDSVIESLEIIQ